MTVRALESPVQLVAAPEGHPLEVNVTLETSVTTPTVILHPISTTETSLVLPANTKRFLLKARASKLQVGYQAGGDYVTVPSGSIYEESEIKRASTTLFLISNAASDTLEVVAWQ